MTCRFSEVAKAYLAQFHQILEEMIHQMNAAETTDSISGEFIAQMIPRHRAAIRMSENLLRYTTSVPLQDIASGIVATQTQGVADLEAAAAQCGRQPSAQRDLGLYRRRFRRIADQMFCEMGNACETNSMEADLIREMIPHHMGAIRMSENALRYTLCPELEPILEAILSSQSRGIREMQRLLRGIS